MSKLSTPKLTLLAMLLGIFCSGLGAAFERPVKGKVDLSSNFCEYRSAHFHGGIDIRTDGNVGREIYSPVDGYVWRIKYSYDGYGKALYLKDRNGFIYVFGHLSRLNDRFERLVWDFQLGHRVYSFDNYYSKDSLPVKSGELVALSGQSGVGPPHIHFEYRDPDNIPQNPLTGGFEIADKIPPQIESVGFIYFDSNSVFSNGTRRLGLKPVYDKSYKKYILKSAIPLRGTFGVTVKAFDQIHQNGPRLNIYKARLKIDDYVYYETVFENYDYAETGMADLCFDYQIAAEKNQSWLQLFIPEGKNFRGDKSTYLDGGLFKIDSYLDYGSHQGRVELYDAAGNFSELIFEFVMLPPDNLFRPTWINDTTCYLESNSNNRYLDLKAPKIFGASGSSGWSPIDSDRLDMHSNGDYQFTIPSGNKKPEALKAMAIGSSGWEIADNYFVIKKNFNANYTLDYKIVDGGLLFNITTRRSIVDPQAINITYDDGYVRKIISSPAGDGHFAAYYKRNEIISTIIKLELLESEADSPVISQNVKIFHVGDNPDGSVSLETGNLSVNCPNKSFYSPTGIEVAPISGIFSNSRFIVGDVYKIGPETIPFAENIDLTFKISNNESDKIGVYRLSGKGAWRWLAHRKTDYTISAETRFAGQFAVIKDTEAPQVRKINPSDGKTISDSYPRISFIISDNLSRIEDHENIKVYLDDCWLIPEYDPETELLKTYPEKRLGNGRHELKIIVTDRVGNSRTINTHFLVNTKKKN